MRIPAFFLLTALAIGVAGGVSSSQAADAACKGLASEPCTGNKDCSWVKPHKIKTGKEIAGFCRKKPTRQSAAPKAPAKSS